MLTARDVSLHYGRVQALRVMLRDLDAPPRVLELAPHGELEAPLFRSDHFALCFWGRDPGPDTASAATIRQAGEALITLAGRGRSLERLLLRLMRSPLIAPCSGRSWWVTICA